jgi:putative membrane protein
MIVIGLTSLVFATVEHRRSMKTLRAAFGEVPYSLAALVAGLIAILGILGLVSVLFRF